jgi:hypothetical protein
VIRKLGDPIGEVSDAGDDPAVQHPHTLSEASNCKGFDSAEKPVNIICHRRKQTLRIAK